MSTFSHPQTCGCHIAAESHAHTPGAGGHGAPESRLDHLRHVLDHAAHYLPAQGPIGVFVHHNTLHAFQHQDFEKSVIEAAHLFKAEPFLSEEVYQNDRARGRILDEDIDDILAREPDAEIIPGRLTRRQLRRTLLVPGVRRVNGLDITWQLEEGDWLTRFRADLPPASAHQLTGDTPKELWDICLTRVKPQSAAPSTRPTRPADAILAKCGPTLALVIHPPLIPPACAYLARGLPHWARPGTPWGVRWPGSWPGTPGRAPVQMPSVLVIVVATESREPASTSRLAPKTVRR